MNYLRIDLSPDEERIFEYRLFHFQGLQIAMNQFLNTNSFEYNEAHYGRLTETYAEKRRLLVEYIIELLEAREYINVPFQGFNFEYAEGSLKLILPKPLIKASHSPISQAG